MAVGSAPRCSSTLLGDAARAAADDADDDETRRLMDASELENDTRRDARELILCAIGATTPVAGPHGAFDVLCVVAVALLSMTAIAETVAVFTAACETPVVAIECRRCLRFMWC